MINKEIIIIIIMFATVSIATAKSFHLPFVGK